MWYYVQVRLFKNTWFNRFAKKEGITNAELREAADRLEAGQADADLGGGVYKVRVARPGEGRTGGYRVIVFFKSEEKTIFVYGFAKSDRANIENDELQGFKRDAKTDLSLSDEQIKNRLSKGTLIEVF